eukprot:1394280-Amorphochlora_amoeboformis.AAC.1
MIEGCGSVGSVRRDGFEVESVGLGLRVKEMKAERPLGTACGGPLLIIVEKFWRVPQTTRTAGRERKLGWSFPRPFLGKYDFLFSIL